MPSDKAAKKAPGTTPTGKKASAKKAAAKKASGKKPSSKKAPGKKASAKKASGKKASGKKASGKKAAGKKATPDSSLPGTLERSPGKVQRTYEKTLESAEEQYDGDEARAHRTAWGAVKNVAEKRGDHWELKPETGPSDPRSTQPADKKRAGVGETFGGVDVIGNTREQLRERAKKAGIRGYSRMTKAELGRHLARSE